MFDLLKTDLKRALKDKLFLVLCIIAGAFAIFTPLLYKGLFTLLEIDAASMQELEMLGLGINAKSMFFQSFSLGNNFGLILPIFVAIILCKDFGHGTIRNKIICGKSRGCIFLSLFLTAAILLCGFIFAHATLTLLISLLFFNYQATGFGAGDFGYLMASIGFELLVYLLVTALLVFFIVQMKNVGLAIVMYFVVSFGMIIVGSITQTMGMFVEPTAVSYDILRFFNTANAFATTAIGNGTSYALKDVLSLLLPNAALATLLAFLGYAAFKKKDIK